MSSPYSIKRDLQTVAAAQSDQSVIAAVPNRQIKVLGAVITAAAATTVLFESGTTALTVALDVAPGAALVLPIHEVIGWFETAPGQALTATTGAGGAVAMHLLYAEV